MSAQNIDNSNTLHMGEPLWGRPGVSPAGGDAPRPAADTQHPLRKDRQVQSNAETSWLLRKQVWIFGTGIWVSASTFQAFGLRLPVPAVLSLGLPVPAMVSKFFTSQNHGFGRRLPLPEGFESRSSKILAWGFPLPVVVWRFKRRSSGFRMFRVQSGLRV